MLGFVVYSCLFLFVLQIYVFTHFSIKKCLKNDYFVLLLWVVLCWVRLAHDPGGVGFQDLRLWGFKICGGLPTVRPGVVLPAGGLWLPWIRATEARRGVACGFRIVSHVGNGLL